MIVVLALLLGGSFLSQLQILDQEITCLARNSCFNHVKLLLSVVLLLSPAFFVNCHMLDDVLYSVFYWRLVLVKVRDEGRD